MRALLIAFVMCCCGPAFAAPDQSLQADLALASARLNESTSPPPEPTAFRYVHNADFDADAIEIDSREQVQPDEFYRTRPLERPAGVPEDFVPVRVFQWREGWRFLGWTLMSLEDVQELHAELGTT